MGHPNRKLLREKKKEKNIEEGLGRRNNLGVMDLTPFNAVKSIRGQALQCENVMVKFS